MHLSLTGNINLLNKSTLNKHVWILYFGTIDHVCFSLSNFSSYHQIKPILIKVSNDHIVSSNYSGTVHFDTKFPLTDVLYVLKFSFNLIFVSKLIFSP